MDAPRIAPELRRNLVRYLAATSAERARLIDELTERNPGMAELLTELEVDDDLRARFEIELLSAHERRTDDGPSRRVSAIIDSALAIECALNRRLQRVRGLAYFGDLRGG